MKERGKIILQSEHPALRKITNPIPREAITSKKVKDVIKKMKQALDAEDDGVAIAAPQIGENLSMFLVSAKAFAYAKNTDDTSNEKDRVFINPSIIKNSKKTKMMEEGCLSCRHWYGKVKRFEKTMIKAFDENGQEITCGGSGLIAQIFQHEIDHLHGILFIDKATGLKDLPPTRENEYEA